MNCAEYQDWVQRRLDGEAGPAETGDGHRRACPRCAGMDEALTRLERGLRLAPPLTPPDRLAENIVFQVLSEQRAAGRRRILVYAAAVAACVALGLYLGSRNTTTPVEAPEAPKVIVEVEPEKPKVNERVGEAGTALASLFTRTADEAVGQGKLLLPSNPMPPMAPDVTGLPPALEPPAQSLKDAGQTVSSGLEPVTSSARRAVTLFFRDMPPVTQGVQ
jgi:hypothetical protein